MGLWKWDFFSVWFLLTYATMSRNKHLCIYKNWSASLTVVAVTVFFLHKSVHTNWCFLHDGVKMLFENSVSKNTFWSPKKTTRLQKIFYSSIKWIVLLRKGFSNLVFYNVNPLKCYQKLSTSKNVSQSKHFYRSEVHERATLENY